jgi:hypothetical protein
VKYQDNHKNQNQYNGHLKRDEKAEGKSHFQGATLPAHAIIQYLVVAVRSKRKDRMLMMAVSVQTTANGKE